MSFPASLTARQRAILHDIAESAGLHHASAGQGDARHIVVGSANVSARKVSVPDKGGSLSDADVAAALLQHLGLNASDRFASNASKGGSGAAAGKGRGANGSGTGVGSKHGGGGGDGSDGSPEPASLEAFVELNRRLIDLERQAEVAQAEEETSLCSPETAQARGRTLLNLRLDDVEGGLLGRTLMTLVPNRGYSAGAPTPELPPHKFGPHDLVAVRPNKGPGSVEGPPLVTGVVYRVREGSLVVAVDEAPEDGMDQPLRLDKLANEVTYQRLRSTLGTLLSAAAGTASTPDGRPLPGAAVLDVVWGRREARFAAAPPSWEPRNRGLDESQRAAVGLALRAQDVALVHGPPGTGKTTAVVEIILQEVARGSRVLAASASNIAVDNLVERLVRSEPKLKVVRLGHPARLLPAVLDSSLEAHVLRSDNSALARDCRAEIKSINAKLLKLGPRDKAERRALRADLRRLGKEERQRQEAAVAEVIKGAQVVCCTLTGVVHRQLESELFDVSVVDEAGQALEAATWGALLRGRRAVLAGDHLQLPPTVVSEEAARQGLSRTLFERLQRLLPSCSAMLTVQYRMNASIMDWASQELYQGKLTAHESVAQHTLEQVAQLPSTSSSKAPTTSSAKGPKGAAASKKKSTTLASSTTSSWAAAAGAAGDSNSSAGAGCKCCAAGGLKLMTPEEAAAAGPLPVLQLVDTAGCGFEEAQEAEGSSYANPGEAKAVMAHVQLLLRRGIPAHAIGIITPYNAQVALLKGMRPERHGTALEISSVDGFQGREKEAIVISMVRSNSGGEVGFLADRRRMNVAVTRARRHCCLVCDTETVSSDPFLQRLVDYFSAHGEYGSAAELVPDA